MIEIIIGTLGMIILLLGWTLVKKHQKPSFILNIVGSMIMVLYGILVYQLVGIAGIPVIILNLIWIIISLNYLRKKK